tara:strand:- start:202 stop:651 length:450 start_codon:yes stop_codon:yes gene_type:complete
MKQITNNKKITMTNPIMTRFTITMNQALESIFRAIKNGMGGEVFVPKLEAYRLGDLKDAVVELLNAKNDTEIISIRIGEKFHESLISVDEIRNTFETDEDYILTDKMDNFVNVNNNMKKTQLKNAYSSDKVKLISKEGLKKMLIKERII